MSNESSAEKVEILKIDDPTNFGFHAAYLAYYEGWNKTADENARRELNRIMSSLAENKMDYPTFYQAIGRYRGNAPDDYSAPHRFKSPSKHAWRESEAKNARTARHKR